jgi:dienelactone hydrolase
MTGTMNSCCLSGFLNDSATPTGREETVHGLPCYIAESSDKSKAKTIIFVADIFGYKTPNVRLLADEYAKAGFYAYVPDFYNGDALPYSFLQSIEPPLKTREHLGILSKTKNTATVALTLGPWAIKHRESVAKPIIDKFFRDVKAMPGVGKIGTIGFCWGGRHATLLVHATGLADAAVICHPALLGIPTDIEAVTKPITFAVGDKDSVLDNESVRKITEILAAKKDVPYEVRVYKDQVHNFALRGDWSSTNDKKAMDDATKQGIDWLTKYLS